MIPSAILTANTVVTSGCTVLSAEGRRRMEEESREEAETGATQAKDEELMERLQEEIRSLPVADHVLYMMHSLSALAVGRMGLAPEAKGDPDLEQARLAIDAFKALLGVVERARPDQAAAHREILSQLQMAFVGVSEGGGTEERP